MARITVEDCEKKVKNKFDLVVLAAQRTRQILAGNDITIKEAQDEKKPVIALREIAAETVSLKALEEAVINGFRTISHDEGLDDDLDDILEEDTYNPYVGIDTKAAESDLTVLQDSEMDVDFLDDIH